MCIELNHIGEIYLYKCQLSKSFFIKQRIIVLCCQSQGHKQLTALGNQEIKAVGLKGGENAKAFLSLKNIQ